VALSTAVTLISRLAVFCIATDLQVYQKEEALPSARLRDESGRMRHQMASLETYVQCACNRPGSQCTSRRGGFSGP